jgi:hypothetical protein
MTTIDIRLLRILLSGDMSTLIGQATAEAPDFARLQLILECMPLPTAEFARLSNQLTNARRYLQQGQAGAANYELCMLSKRLKQFAC